MQTVHLNGGPLNGRDIAVQDGVKLFYIVKIDEQNFNDLAASQANENTQELKKRKGTYSQVQYYPGHFEWDGWQSLD